MAEAQVIIPQPHEDEDLVVSLQDYINDFGETDRIAQFQNHPIAVHSYILERYTTAIDHDGNRLGAIRGDAVGDANTALEGLIARCYGLYYIWQQDFHSQAA
jgi:hypothetical protein